MTPDAWLTPVDGLEAMTRNPPQLKIWSHLGGCHNPSGLQGHDLPGKGGPRDEAAGVLAPQHIHNQLRHHFAGAHLQALAHRYDWHIWRQHILSQSRAWDQHRQMRATVKLLGFWSDCRQRLAIDTLSVKKQRESCTHSCAHVLGSGCISATAG